MGETTVECPYCWEVVSWSEVPEHLAEHGGELEVELVGVSGEEPQMQAVGESSGDHVRIVRVESK
jgi:hypothetical protein